MPWATSGPSMTFTVFERVNDWKNEMQLWNLFRKWKMNETELFNKVNSSYEKKEGKAPEQ